MLRRWRGTLAERAADAGQRTAGARRRLPVLAAQVSAPTLACRRSLEGFILPGAALYLELRERTDQGQALAVTGACIASDAQRAARVLRLVDRTPWLLPLLRFARKHRGDSRVPPAWESTVLEDTPERVQFEITRCYYLDTLTALGIPELTACYCHNDDVTWGGLRHLEFRREGTLALGSDRCDFCFQRRSGGP